MYSSISEVWNEENTMSSLAKRFNNEYFSNYNDLNTNYYKINSNNFNDNEHFTQDDSIKETVKESVSNVSNNIISIDQTKIPSKIEAPKTEKKGSRQPTEIILDDFTCNQLVNKVLSCKKCNSILRKRLGINYNLSLDFFSNIFKSTNKEIIILILIGLIIIIILDLFIKLSISLN